MYIANPRTDSPRQRCHGSAGGAAISIAIPPNRLINPHPAKAAISVVAIRVVATATTTKPPPDGIHCISSDTPTSQGSKARAQLRVWLVDPIASPATPSPASPLSLDYRIVQRPPGCLSISRRPASGSRFPAMPTEKR